MPLYEYQCESCEHRFERIQKFSDPPVETCPSCGGNVKKLLSSPAIQFKGSGWYITDYAKKPKGEAKPGTATKDSSAAEGSADPGTASTKDSSAKESKDSPAPNVAKKE